MVPIAVALLLVGLLPNVPVLQGIERRLRQYAHGRAYIPEAALATAERLSAADFDFSTFGGEALQSPELQGVEAADFTRSRRTLEHSWARLSCLVYELKWRRMSGLIESLDVDLLRSYERDLESIEDKRNSMKAEVASYRAEKANNPAYVNEALYRTIRNNLYKLYILLGCAVRLKKQPHDDIDLALRPFGFKLGQTTPASDNRDLTLVGITVLGASVLALEFAAVGLVQPDLWQVTIFFPATWYQPFVDTATVLVVYGTSLLAADWARARRIKKGSWFAAAGSKRRPNAANYVRVAFVCAVVGYASMILWGMPQAWITLNGLKMQAPFMLISAVTGAFYAYHLDNAELQMRPARWHELGLQVAVTAICGLIAAAASFGALIGDASEAYDSILLTGAVGATAGAALAWYLPEAAAAMRPDPLSEAREERVRMLEAAALKRFGTSGAAAEWLEKPHAALDNKSPKAAAADLSGFDHAISLLQGPKMLAA